MSKMPTGLTPGRDLGPPSPAQVYKKLVELQDTEMAMGGTGAVTTATLTDEFEIGRQAMKRRLQALKDDGLVETRWGFGSKPKEGHYAVGDTDD